MLFCCCCCFRFFILFIYLKSRLSALKHELWTVWAFIPRSNYRCYPPLDMLTPSGLSYLPIKPFCSLNICSCHKPFTSFRLVHAPLLFFVITSAACQGKQLGASTPRVLETTSSLPWLMNPQDSRVMKAFVYLANKLVR